MPSIVAAFIGASAVVVTDYPDAELIENLRINIEQNCEGHDIHAEGYLWGADVAPLTRHLAKSDGCARFDLLILADLLFNHSEHGKLVSTVQQTLARSRNAQALVFFTPYRPWLYEKDMAFFDLAKQAGFSVEKVLERVMEKVMFEEDPGVRVAEEESPKLAC